jgi:two-component system, LytTR family, sensor kinase
MSLDKSNHIGRLPFVSISSIPKEYLDSMSFNASLIENYIFTNTAQAELLLAKQEETLQRFQDPLLLIQFHLHAAILENQFYRYRESEIHFKLLLAMLEEYGDVNQQTEAYIDYAGTLLNLGEKDLAMDYIDRAAKNLNAFPDKLLTARLTFREGYLWLHYGDNAQAVELFLEADKQFNAINPMLLKVKDIYFTSLIYSGLGSIFNLTGELDLSVKFYLNTVNICESNGIRSRLAWHYLNVGKAYMALNDYEHAEGYFLEVNQIQGDMSEYARALASLNLGYCHFLSGRYEEALDLYNKSETLTLENIEEDFDNLSMIAYWKGLLFDALGRSKRAKQHLGEALEYAGKGKNTRQQAVICEAIASFYAERKEYKNAYEYQVLHDQFLKRHVEATNLLKIKEVEVRFEAEKKRKEAEFLRLQATELQMKALRAQMNPHFMYNALNSIQHYITSDNADFAAKYLAKFAKLMRASLEYSELEIISLEDEVVFLEDYLYLNQKLRFDNQLQYDISIDEEIESDILGVPTMIVQPYVENAIEHGLRGTKGGFLSLKFTLIDDDNVLCVIQDNGIGRVKARKMQEADQYAVKHKSRGTSITEKRLELLHQAKKDRVFVKTIDLIDELSGGSAGTRVEIQIPVVDIQLKSIGANVG